MKLGLDRCRESTKTPDNAPPLPHTASYAPRSHEKACWWARVQLVGVVSAPWSLTHACNAVVSSTGGRPRTVMLVRSGAG